MDNVIAAHKRIEQTLRHLAMIAEQAEEGIALIDLNGTIQFVNTALVRMHGYNTKEEIIGKTIDIFHTKEHMETDVTAFIEEAQLRGQLSGPMEHMRRGGTTFPTQMKMILVKDEGGKGIGLIVFVTDITQRRQAREQLKQQAEELITIRKQLQEQITQRSQIEEQLQEKMARHEQAERELKEYREQLERQPEEKTSELTAVNEKLQQKIIEQQKVDERLKRQTTELTATIEQLQQKIVDGIELEEITDEDIEQVRKAKELFRPFDEQTLKKLAELAKRLS